MVKRLLILALLLAGSAGAEGDLTPYNYAGAGNAQNGMNNYTVTWMAGHYDLFYNDGDYSYLGDSIQDTIDNWGTPKMFKWGPYASPHEINMYEAGGAATSYATRMANTTKHWLYIYAYSFLVDTSAISAESLVVHIADDMAAITVDGDGYRRLAIDSLSLAGPTARMTYQYWNNIDDGNPFYPAGYTWLANGKNADARRAIVSAYKRHFFNDTASQGSGTHHRSLLYADNYYRGGSMPRQSSYYEIDSTRGGNTSYLDWVEQDGIGLNANATTYFDEANLPLIGAIDSMLVVEADNQGWPDTIITFANIDKFDAAATGIIIKETSLHYELMFPYTGDGWNKWRHIWDNADTLRGRNDDAGGDRRYAIWEMRLDALDNPAAWNTLDRLFYEAYAWFLVIQSSNQYIHPVRFDDTLKFRDIALVDFGDPIDTTRDTILMDGSCDAYGYGDCIYLWRCKYDNSGDTAIALFLSGRGSETGQLTDTFPYYLGGYFKKVDVNGDTAEASVDTAYMRPCEGWIGVQGGGPSEQPPSISGLSSSKDTVDVQTTITATCTDDYGIDSVDLFVYLPDSTAWVNDSVSILDTLLGADETTYNLSETYLWDTTGGHWVYLVLVDDSDNVKTGSLYVDVQAAEEPPAATAATNFRGGNFKGGGK